LASYTQTDRPLKITTPLGPDILLLTGFRGYEEISKLFKFKVSLIADLNKEVRFDGIVGQSVTMEMHQVDGSTRYFNGIVRRFSQGTRDENFLHFKAQVVPKFWLLTKKVRSRVFQHKTVPEILKLVLVGFDVNYDITGTYYQRDYCVQYRESDFDFASRLMEEEGIYYFFKHSDGNHQMMVSDNTSKHPTVAGQSTVIYEEATGDVRPEMRVSSWEKTQEIRAGECTLWDHCFEIPPNHLEAKEKTIVSVPVGKVTHKLNLANDTLEMYDFPGRYAQRFDAVDPGGGDRPDDITHMFEDRTRTVRLRMEQEEVNGILIEGKSDCGQFTAGHKFTLERHFDADAGYLLTRVDHDAVDDGFRSDHPDTSQFRYENSFTCIPEALRFRPQRVTEVPVISGMQTATVVGPPGEEVWVDKYGRVKVQFYWDREGKMNADSSCWVRVAQVWAGKRWGGFLWPRIGHEVVVIFEEGDPDQPLIIGSVYNKDNMPPYELPKGKLYGGIRSASVEGEGNQNFNGIVFVDKKGHEHLSIHSERHMVFNAEFDKLFRAGRHHGERVPGARTVTVGGIPGGGGSGGGPNQNLWPKGGGGVEPTAIAGLNSTVVYGANYQIAAPLNFQMAIGSNLQICINPSSLMSLLPSIGVPPTTAAVAEFMGSGLGGNMQLTLGTSANFVIGQSFDINLGPRRIVVDVHDRDPIQTYTKVVSWIIIGIVTIFMVAYALLHDDDDRAILLMGFGLAMQILLLLLMTSQQLYNGDDKDGHHLYRPLFVTAQTATDDPQLGPYADARWPAMTGLVVGATAGTLIILPPLLEASGETKLDTVPPSSS
jgi:type VI secretion system secreted protein VgrG